MSLKEYREKPSEKARIDSLITLIPAGQTLLDIGTRDGHLAKMLAEKYAVVTALDLETPEISHPKVVPVKGNVGSLQFSDESFDTVLCAEVLEHLPGRLLQKACSELSRVAKRDIIVGVPYKQDIRVGRTTCFTCGARNPPWGHVNSFDEKKLKRLFPGWKLASIDFVGETRAATNWMSTVLLDYAGNPFGTYDQDETCIHCDSRLVSPPRRTLIQKACTRMAYLLSGAQSRLTSSHPNWIHVRFQKV